MVVESTSGLYAACWNGQVNRCAALCCAVQVMVANIRCAEIMREQLSSFEGEEWAELSRQAEEELVPEFGVRTGSLVADCLAGALAWCCAL
jgi:hypothetical protein